MHIVRRPGRYRTTRCFVPRRTSLNNHRPFETNECIGDLLPAPSVSTWTRRFGPSTRGSRSASLLVRTCILCPCCQSLPDIGSSLELKQMRSMCFRDLRGHRYCLFAAPSDGTWQSALTVSLPAVRSLRHYQESSGESRSSTGHGRDIETVRGPNTAEETARSRQSRGGGTTDRTRPLPSVLFRCEEYLRDRRSVFCRSR